MNDNINYKMITIAREMRGLTQTDLAKKIPRLSQGNLSKMEKGIIGVSEEIVEKIATVLNFPMTFFYESYIFPPFSNVYYRKLVTTSVKKMSQLEAVFKTTMFVVDNLLSSIDIPEYNIPQLDVESGISVCEIAQRVRYALGIADGPIEKLSEELEKNGVIIIEINTDIEKFSGLSARTQNGATIIFLNDNMPNDRKRFTIVHELGHIVMHIPYSVELSPDRDLEKEANVFAGEFLMPYKDFRKDYSVYTSYNELDVLKRYWGVSKQAIVRKAFNDKIIDGNKYQSMMVQFSMYGERKIERGNVSYYEPQLLKKILEAFYNDLGYTQADLMEAIKVDIRSIPISLNKISNTIPLNSKKRIYL